jgi:hypothetical protein
MGYFENIERIFNDDIRDKKRTGNGAFHMRGKGVKHGMNGALKTPYHYMKAKEKRQLNGEVKVFNMYETILTKEEFFLKDIETQKHMLARWREIYSNTIIKKEMGLHNAGFYNLVEKLGLPKKDRGGARDTKTRKSVVKTTVPMEQPLVEQTQHIEQPTIRPQIISNGLHLEYNGEYTADQLSKILTKLQLLTEGEENKFLFSLSITERA